MLVSNILRNGSALSEYYSCFQDHTKFSPNILKLCLYSALFCIKVFRNIEQFSYLAAFDPIIFACSKGSLVKHH